MRHSEMLGPTKVRELLDNIVFSARSGGAESLKYDWENLQLWRPERRWFYKHPDTCQQVWEEMNLVASRVLKGHL